MVFKRLDLFILISLQKTKTFTLKQLSIRLMTDKSVIFKSLKRLTDANLVLIDNNRPKQYYLNEKAFEKWKSKN